MTGYGTGKDNRRHESNLISTHGIIDSRIGNKNGAATGHAVKNNAARHGH